MRYIRYLMIWGGMGWIGRLLDAFMALGMEVSISKISPPIRIDSWEEKGKGIPFKRKWLSKFLLIPRGTWSRISFDHLYISDRTEELLRDYIVNQFPEPDILHMTQASKHLTF